MTQKETALHLQKVFIDRFKYYLKYKDAKDNRPVLAEAIESFWSALKKGNLKLVSKAKEWSTEDWIVQALANIFALLSKVEVKGYKQINDEYSEVFLSYDKVSSLFEYLSKGFLDKRNIRVGEQAIVRRGVHLGKNIVLMPGCFLNVGASIGDGTMIDVNARIGSGAQIGKNCHISGGVGIGGVLEPRQKNPVIIEDNCFVGANACISEGVVIGEGSIIGPGVIITGSTLIVDKIRDTTYMGGVPKGAVIVSGSRVRLFPKGRKAFVYSPIVIKYADEKVHSKTEINKLLRM